MLTTMVHDHADRLRSYELVAQTFAEMSSASPCLGVPASAPPSSGVS